MATHSSILAWRIPWTEEPGGLQSVGSHRVTRLKRVSTYDCTSEVPVGFGVLFCFIFLYIVCPATHSGKLHLLASFTCWQASPAHKLHLLASFTCSQASHAHKLHMLTSFTCSQAPGVGDGQGKPGVLQSMGSQRVKHS